MTRKTRLILAAIILVISISLLVWGYLPNAHVTLDRNIAPSEMQLPTPASLQLDVRPLA